MLRLFALGLSALAAWSAPARAAAPGDASIGERLARQWCASCHVVGPGQQSATVDVPTFASISRRSDFDEQAVAFFLLDPHPKMPNLALTRREAADLAAYIATLK